MGVMDVYKEKNHFMTYNSIEPIFAGEDSSEVAVTLSEKGVNLSGYAHGGLLMTLADCAAGMAARGDGRNYVTQSVHMNFISNIKQGTIHAKGQVIHRGRTVTSVRVTITDERNVLMADATVNMFCIGKKDA